MRPLLATLLVVVGNGVAHPLWAQSCADDAPDCVSTPKNVGWKEASIFAAGVVGLMILDEDIHDAVQDWRGSTGDVVLEPFRAFGNGWTMAVASGGTLLVGLATGDEELTQTGERLVATLALAAGLVHTTKFLLGRSRPSAGEGAWSYHPFTPGSSFYSGHSTMAFSMATALSEEIDNTVGTVVLYSAAVLAGYSRVNDNDHWFSDVVVGAVMGITTAKFVYGRWTVFGLRAPTFLAGPDGVQVSYRFQF